MFLHFCSFPCFVSTWLIVLDGSARRLSGASRTLAPVCHPALCPRVLIKLQCLTDDDYRIHITAAIRVQPLLRSPSVIHLSLPSIHPFLHFLLNVTALPQHRHMGSRFTSFIHYIKCIYSGVQTAWGYVNLMKKLPAVTRGIFCLGLCLEYEHIATRVMLFSLTALFAFNQKEELVRVTLGWKYFQEIRGLIVFGLMRE